MPGPDDGPLFPVTSTPGPYTNFPGSASGGHDAGPDFTLRDYRRAQRGGPTPSPVDRLPPLRGGTPLPRVPIALPGALVTGEEMFESLLQRPRSTPAPASPFRQLLERGPLSDFERLLARDYVPRVLERVSTAARTAGRLLVESRWALGLGALLYSGEVGAGSDFGKPELDRIRRKGPRRRPRRFPRPPGPDVPSRPAIRAPATRPQLPLPAIPEPLAPVRVHALRLPSPLALVRTAPVPAQKPSPQPAPAPRPMNLPRVQLLSSFDPLQLFRTAPSVRPRRDTVTRFQPGQLSEVDPRARPGARPLTSPKPKPVASPSQGCGPCSSKRTQRERKRKCSNPQVSTQRETRGGVEYLITTRKITCPSSRKKPR
jgi:hypothetical protein